MPWKLCSLDMPCQGVSSGYNYGICDEEWGLDTRDYYRKLVGEEKFGNLG